MRRILLVLLGLLIACDDESATEVEPTEAEPTEAAPTEAAPTEAAPTEAAPAETERPATSGQSGFLPVADVDWQQLNPARGDASPLAGTLWGDRNGTSATGFLFRPVDGFRSPPHIHNVAYRGVVIRGLVHNADPEADEVWMPAGSYWTQPKGDVHITAARGDDTLAYIEIDEGPYLVWPVARAFEHGDPPVNVDPSDIEWASESNIVSGEGPEVAFLWGNPGDDDSGGLLVRLPAAARATLRGSSRFRAVVIQGRPKRGNDESMEPGSLLQTTEERLSCAEVCVVYIRKESGSFEVVAE